MVRRVMIASVVKFTELISDSCVKYSEIHSAREHNSLKQSYSKKNIICSCLCTGQRKIQNDDFLFGLVFIKKNN